MHTHSGDKPYSCEICGDSFRTKGNLKAHMPNHTDGDTGNLYKCEICGKCFNRIGSLKIHLRTRGVHGQELS